MKRRQILVAYDIADDKRRTSVYKRLIDEGERLQYSVFLCETTATERTRLEAELESLIHHNEDQIVLLDLGPDPTMLEHALTTIGKPWNPPSRVQII